MRLCPITAIPLERIVDKSGMLIGNYNIPAGTTIGTSIPAIHLNHEIFGSDANEFRPERWQDAPKDAVKQMEKAFLGVSLQAIHVFDHPPTDTRSGPREAVPVQDDILHFCR